MPESFSILTRITTSVGARRRWVRWMAPFATALLTAAGASTAVNAATSARLSAQLTYYSIASAEQFLDHSDDRTRGEGNNPFGAFADTPAVAEPGSNGPFAGDQAVYKLNLYPNA